MFTTYIIIIIIYYYFLLLLGLKNAFRMAVTQVRSQSGLDIDSTNAPSSQMESIQNYVVCLYIYVDYY